MEREIQKRQGDNWAVSQTLEAVLMKFFAGQWCVDTMGELAGEKQTKTHAKISTKTSGTCRHGWELVGQIIHAKNLFQNMHTFIAPQNTDGVT